MNSEHQAYIKRMEEESKITPSDPIEEVREYFINLLTQYYTSNIIPTLSEEDIDFMEKTVERLL